MDKNKQAHNTNFIGLLQIFGKQILSHNKQNNSFNFIKSLIYKILTDLREFAFKSYWNNYLIKNVQIQFGAQLIKFNSYGSIVFCLKNLIYLQNFVIKHLVIIFQPKFMVLLSFINQFMIFFMKIPITLLKAFIRRGFFKIILFIILFQCYLQISHFFIMALECHYLVFIRLMDSFKLIYYQLHYFKDFIYFILAFFYLLMCSLIHLSFLYFLLLIITFLILIIFLDFPDYHLIFCFSLYFKNFKVLRDLLLAILLVQFLQLGPFLSMEQKFSSGTKISLQDFILIHCSILAYFITRYDI